MSSRERILGRLRAAQAPFKDLPVIEQKQAVVPVSDRSPSALTELFVREAQTVGCTVHSVSTATQALEIFWSILEMDQNVLSWEPQRIPIDGLAKQLSTRGIEVAAVNDGQVRVGLTGASAGLAATGSLVVLSGDGRHRLTSLLPDVHVVVLLASQIVPDLEQWIRSNPDAFREPSNTVIITGPSKTADIAQELIKGAHGPRQVHILLIG